jgi:hypothetical protein
MPKPLIKMTIPFGQYGHFSQVGPSKKSCFLEMDVVPTLVVIDVIFVALLGS